MKDTRSIEPPQRPPEQGKSVGSPGKTALAAPLPDINIFETAPVQFDPAGIAVVVPLTLTVKATLRRTTEEVRGWLLDVADPTKDTQHNGAADGINWKYEVPINDAGRNYIFQASLVTVAAGGAETVVASHDLSITS